MARRYLDEGGFLERPIGPFAMHSIASLGTYETPSEVYNSGNNTIKIISTGENRSKNKRKKKNSNSSNIIRNYDRVWDYKINNGELFTKRKGSNSSWINITNNSEARQKIESFTGKRIDESVSKKSNIESPVKVEANTNERKSTAQDTPISVEKPIIKQLAEYPASNYSPSVMQPGAPFNLQHELNRFVQPSIRLSDSDLKYRNWHWGGIDDIAFEGVSNSLYADAVKKAQEQGRVLLDDKNRPVTNRDVNLYLNYKTPDKISSYDSQFLYQPQVYSTPSYVRQSIDSRRNKEFDRQRNTALATMFGLPLAGIGGAELLMAGGPVALMGSYLGSDLGGKLVNEATRKAYGKTWDEISDDPNVNFYAQLGNPGRLIGGLLGGYGGYRIQNRISPIQQYPSGEYEFMGDKIGQFKPKQSTLYNKRTASMLSDPNGEVPVISQIVPGYATEIPTNTIRVTPTEEPLWYDGRFMATLKDMQDKGLLPKPKKRSIKSTKGKKTKKQIVEEAYNKAYTD